MPAHDLKRWQEMLDAYRDSVRGGPIRVNVHPSQLRSAIEKGIKLYNADTGEPLTDAELAALAREAGLEVRLASRKHAL